jgi:hypothetical protein
LFGPAFVGIKDGSTNDFSNWKIGQFAGEATLTATTSSSASSQASLFGAAFVGNGNSTTNNFSGWQIGQIAEEAHLTAMALGAG